MHDDHSFLQVMAEHRPLTRDVIALLRTVFPARETSLSISRFTALQMACLEGSALHGKHAQNEVFSFPNGRPKAPLNEATGS
jgi:hypothetical protein